jgi:succinate dehydrogenase / fumarate reductase cytochrome b subunit
MSQSSVGLASITRKTIMALAGLFLIVFLAVHLGINLFLLPIAENNKEIFEEAAHFMGTNPLVKFMELFLIAAFIIHIVYGVIVQIQNWKARKLGYKVMQKTKTSFFSKHMFWTGLVIFLFLAIHFYQFYFIKLGFVAAPEHLNIPHPQEEYFYDIAVYLFTYDIFFSILYIVSFIALSLHLNHAMQSAFQTLGLNHPKYMPWVKGISTVYSILIGLGFSAIPLYFMIAG